MSKNNYERDCDGDNDGNYYDNNDDHDCDDDNGNEDDNDDRNYNINDSSDEEAIDEKDWNTDTTDDSDNNDENDDDEKYPNRCVDNDDDDVGDDSWGNYNINDSSDEEAIDEKDWNTDTTDDSDNNDENDDDEKYPNRCVDDDDDDIGGDDSCDNHNINDSSDEEAIDEKDWNTDTTDDSDNNDKNDDDEKYPNRCVDEDDDDDDGGDDSWGNYNINDSSDEEAIDEKDWNTDTTDDSDNNDKNDDDEKYPNKCISRHQRKKELPEPVLRLLEMIFEETFNGNQAAAYAKYKTLNTSIKLLPTNTEEYQIICQYVTNGHGPTHKFKITIEHIFEIHRSGEYAEFQKNKKRHRRLLWHGTKSKNLVSILKNGLRTQAPPATSQTGKLFDKGIFFADVCTEAAQFCKVNVNDPYGIMILADVALGKQSYLSKPNDIKKLRNGKHTSVKSLGRYKPDFSKSVKYKYGAYVPNGPLEHKTDRNTCFDYSEYFVYKHDRIMLEYLVLVKIQC